MYYSLIDNADKIAVLRAGALGEFIVVLPALKALRSAYPKAEIVLMGRAWQQKFLIKNRTCIDRVIVVPAKKVIDDEVIEDNEAVMTLFYRKMQKEKFDIALNMQGNGVTANAFVNALGAKCTAGLTSEKAQSLNRSIGFYYYQSEIIRYLEVAKLVGANAFDLEPELRVFKEDEHEADAITKELNERYIVLHPFAIDVRRIWPLRNYAALADKLRMKNFNIVFSGSTEDKAGINSIMSAMNADAVNACGKLSVGGLAALLSKAALVIGADTGPLHLARAVKTPTVGIYWAPNFINWGPVTRSIHHPVISWQMQCPLCGEIPNNPYPFEPKSNCDHAVSFVRNITIGEVLDAANGLLKKNAGNTKAWV